MVWLNLNGMLEHYPINQKVAGSIPGQGTGLGWKFGPSRCTYERQPINVSLSY